MQSIIRAEEVKIKAGNKFVTALRDVPLSVCTKEGEETYEMTRHLDARFASPQIS